MSVLRTAMAMTVLLAPVSLGLGACETMTKTRDMIVRRPATCADQTVQIYFETDSADVTDEGKAVIRQAASQAKGCTVRRVDVVGLTDATGAPGANLELSKRRAQSVTAALASAGLPAAEFNVAARGQAGAMTSSGQAAPLRRRADITLRLDKWGK